MSADPIIYVVDDDDDARESTCALISQMALRVEAYSSAEDFLKNYSGHRPACLLTDHRMLGMTGVELLESLRNKGVTLSVIVMTAFADTELTVRAIRSGAVTLLEKPFSSSALWDAMNEALAEDRIRYVEEAKTKRISERFDTLTPSEIEVLKLIVRGETNKAVALKVGVSIRTVESRRSSIFEKMDISSVAELVHHVMIARPELC
ncbi:MAG: response regulator [Fuerstiella sp.]